MDFSRLPVYKVRKWVRNRIEEIVGSEDEILTDYCMNQLIYKTRKSTADEEFQISPQEFLANIKGFLGESSSKFVSDLWNFLSSEILDDSSDNCKSEDGNFGRDNNKNKSHNRRNSRTSGERRERAGNKGDYCRYGGGNSGKEHKGSYRYCKPRHYNENLRDKHYRENRFTSGSHGRRHHLDLKHGLSNENDSNGSFCGEYKENRDHRERTVKRSRSFSRSLSPLSDGVDTEGGLDGLRGEYSRCNSPTNSKSTPIGGDSGRQSQQISYSVNSCSEMDRHSAANQEEKKEARPLSSSDQADVEEKLLRKRALEVMRRRSAGHKNRSTSEEKLRSIALEKLKEKRLIK